MDNTVRSLECLWRFSTYPIKHFWFILFWTLGWFLMGSIVQKLQHCSCILFIRLKLVQQNNQSLINFSFLISLFLEPKNRQQVPLLQFTSKDMGKMLNTSDQYKFLIDQIIKIKNFFIVFTLFKETNVNVFANTNELDFKKIIFHKTEMKPNRPGSAKSTHTRVTVDSDFSSNALNVSKFSQTYSNGVNANNEKKKDFHDYVKQKNKDPRFKKFVEPQMPEIPQKMDTSLELSKLTSKPFEKKNSKIEKPKPEKKVEEQPPSKKPTNNLIKNSSIQNANPKTFMDKSKQKLKVAPKKQLQTKEQVKKYQSNNGANGTNGIISNANQRINLTGFTIKVPGKPVQKIEQIKKQVGKKKTAEEEEQQRKRLQRQKIFTQLSEFVSDVESRNLDNFPARYDDFVENNLSRVRADMDIDIQKINIEDFLNEPNQRDYEKLLNKISECDKKLEGKDQEKSGRKKIGTESSINLQQILDGTERDQNQEKQQSINDISVMISSMTASDVRQRNMFLTQILKGKRLTEEQLQNIHQNDQSRIKLIKLNNDKPAKEDDEDGDENYEPGYITQLNNLSTVSSKSINMTKKKNNRFLQRNKIEAAGQLFRQCDYLSPEEQQRIEDLINGAQIQSPFIFSEMENFKNRRIEEGIKIHRQMHRDIDGENSENDSEVINEAALPKDPLLKKEAELKLLKQKINSVNSRLRSVEQVVVNKNKIKNLVDKYKQVTKVSKMGESLIEQKKKQLQEESRKLKQAQQLILKADGQKEQINQILRQMEKRYIQMQNQLQRIKTMDEKELRKMYEDDLKEKRRKVEQVEREVRYFDEELQGFLQVGEELKQHLQALDDIMNIRTEEIKCENYHEDETIEDLDQLITRKWQAAEQAVKDIQSFT